MTSKESLVAKTVLLKQVPTCVALENIFTYIANKLDNGKIEKYIRQTEEENDEDSNTWILLMNSAEAVNRLVSEDHEMDYESITIKPVFERATYSSLPSEWHLKSDSDLYGLKFQHSHLGPDEKEDTDTDKTDYKLRIRELPSDITQQYLDLYFDDDDIFEDCTIRNVCLDESGQSAMIFFDSSKDIEKFMEIQPLNMDGTILSVEKCTIGQTIKHGSVLLRTIEVTGPPDSNIISERNKSLLKMYFKNQRKSCGGRILDLTLELNKAYITFETEEVARMVIEKESHQLSGNELTVKQYNPSIDKIVESEHEQPFKVVLSNLPELIDYEYIELYFDDEERFGEALVVESVTFDDDHTTAIVEFRDEDAVKKLLDTPTLEMEDREVHLQKYLPMEGYSHPQTVIEVHGPPEIVEDKNFKMLKKYFENQKFSDGGEIVDSSISPGSACFTYKTEEVASRVVGRKHVFRKCPLEVHLREMNKHGTAYGKLKGHLTHKSLNKIIVTRVPPEIDSEDLTLFFENLGNDIEVKEISLCEESRQFSIEFTNSDAVRIVMDNRPLVIKETTLSIEKWESTKIHTISVQGIPDIQQYMDKLELYFKHRKSGGNSEVIDRWVDKETNTAYFTYEDEAVARNVAQKGQHSLGKHNLDVRLSNKWRIDTSNVHEKRHESVESLTKIKLQNLPESVDETFLEFFLEDITDEITDFKVLNVELQPESHSAVIELNNPEAAKLLSARRKVFMKNVEVSVDKFNSNAVHSRTIAVSGLSKIGEHIELLEMYFQGKKSLGNSKVVDSWTDPKANVAYFTFPSEEVAERVVAKTDHVFNQKTLTVWLFSEDYILEKPKMIQVLNLPDDITEEYLMLFFEQQDMPFDFSVVSVTKNSKQAFAVIEFDHCKAVHFILKKNSIRIKRKDLEIKPYVLPNSSSCSIEVRGIPNIEGSLETLYLYFKNRRSGGGSIVEYHADKDSNKAYFTFENAEVVRGVLLKDHTNVWEGIKVSLVRDCQNEGDGVDSNIIRVSGIKGVARETLQYYFGNKSASGGGKISSIQGDINDEDVIYIQFTDRQDADCVVGKSHKVEGQTITTRIYVPPPYYETKVLLKGIPGTTSQESIFHFLEAKTGIQALQIAYSEDDDDVAIVTMGQPPDITKLTEACQNYSLDGSNLTVGRVPLSNCVYLANIPFEVSEDTIRFYFEFKFGEIGKVEKTIMNKSEGTCLVYFQDFKVVDNLLKQEHTLGGKIIDVKCYQALLKGPEVQSRERVFRVPDSIDLSHIEPRVLEFCHTVPFYRKKLEEELSKEYGNLKWPSQSNKTALINCTLDLSARGCFRRAKIWTEQIMKIVNVFFGDLSLIKLDVLPDIWDSLTEHLKSISIKKPESAQVFLNKLEHGIVIVGENGDVDKTQKEINCTMTKLKQKFEKDQQRYRDNIRGFQPIELCLMNRNNAEQKVKQHFDDLQMEIDIENNVIAFEGSVESVKEAQIKVYEMKSNFGKRQVKELSKMCIALYKSKDVVHFIQNILEENGLQAVWELNESSLLICCMQEEMLDECTEIILGGIKEEVIEYDADSVPYMRTDTWAKKKNSLLTHYNGKIGICDAEDETQVIVCVTKDVHKAVIAEVKQFLDSSTIMSENLYFSKEVIRLIEKHHRQEIADIENGQKAYSVQIKMLEHYCGIYVCGLSPGLQETVRQLTKLNGRVKKTKYTVRKPGVAEYIRKAKGKDSINTVETLFKCTISIEGGNIGITHVGSTRVAAECTCLGDRKLIALVGDMTELEVDMLVNPDDKQMHLLGCLGRVIISKGGKSIKDECEDYITRNGELAINDVFVSKGGALNAKYISHVLSQEWSDGNETLIKTLEDSVFNCLTEAYKRRLSSIAIPAIGCGVNGFPQDVATTAIVKSVRKFFLEVQDSSMTEIYFCGIDEVTTGCFTNALCSLFGHGYVITYNDDAKPPTEGMDRSNMHIARNKRHITAKGSQAKDTKITPMLTNVNGVQKGKLGVKIVKGEIANEKVDIIVNTTSFALTLDNGIVSKSLLMAAGKELQMEVDSKYPNGLNNDRIAITSGHGLKCKQVFHTALKSFDAKSERQSRQQLFDVIRDCLDEGEKQGHSSIAFPAIGTGNLNYPHNVVAEEMFKSVTAFGSTKSIKNLLDVRFILYHRDDKIIQAFNTEKSKIQIQGPTVMKELGGDSPLEDSNTITRMFKNVQVTVKFGDLLAEGTHCIVNSTNEDLDMSIGAVSKVILQKGGQNLQKEIDQKKSMMKSEHLVITSAPNLPSKTILHIALNGRNGLQTDVLKCLNEAEKQKMISIAFPALGTGGHTLSAPNIPKCAQEMASAFKTFSSKNPKHVKEVRLVVFQREMFDPFYTTIDAEGETKTMLTRLKNKVNNSEYSDESQKNSDVNKVTFCIYSFGEDEMDKAIRKLDAFLEKEMESKTFTDYIIQQLDTKQVLEIRSIALQHNCEIKIDKQRCMIKICGMKDNFFEAYDKIQSFIKNAIQIDYMSNIAQWYFIDVTHEGDDVLEYDRDLNLKIETAYKQNDKQMEYSFDGKKFIIDFERMEEYPEDDKLCVLKVLRRNVVKGGATDIPPRWGDLQGGNLRVVDLKQDEQEYKDMEQIFLNSVYPWNVIVLKLLPMAKVSILPLKLITHVKILTLYQTQMA